MLRQKWGSVVCPSCGNLVGVNDEQCLNCGRRHPRLWGFAPLLNRLGRYPGFTQLLLGVCISLYLLMLVVEPSGITIAGLFNFQSPSRLMLFLFGEIEAYPVFVYGRLWTVLTAGWLHAGLLHIFINMMWI